MAVRQALDHAVEAQAAELIGDGASADGLGWAALEVGDVLAQVGAAEAVGEQAEQQQGVPQVVDLGIGEAQAGSALAIATDRAFDRLEGGLGEHAVVAETFELEQASIGGEADLAQLRQVGQALADLEVGSVVDRGLGPQRAAFLVILLDAGALVVDVQRRRDPPGEDTGAEAARGWYG